MTEELSNMQQIKDTTITQQYIWTEYHEKKRARQMMIERNMMKEV
jgi:hypothetical protein